VITGIGIVITGIGIVIRRIGIVIDPLPGGSKSGDGYGSDLKSADSLGSPAPGLGTPRPFLHDRG